ncbi:OsmC family peroxiredoxin [Luteococcus peritonei]|uniref:OsmC family peroxiredoxin n=1 Tax=Luteococcus peritonei TaxID=88874 RepID=A0ABW4RVA0_9ACTN
MATTNTATTHWEGTLMEGQGRTELATSGVAGFDVKWAARAEAGQGTTNPEELIAAAHATCYSMALSNKLAQDGTPATSLDTAAEVSFQPGQGITGITLKVSGDVPGLSADDFAEKAEWAKENCPVSQALASVPKTLEIV